MAGIRKLGVDKTTNHVINKINSYFPNAGSG